MRPPGNHNASNSEERSEYSYFHRLVFNLKRIIEKVPFGKTAFASYAVALLLLKEETNLDQEQTDQLFEDFYKYLKETIKLNKFDKFLNL